MASMARVRDLWESLGYASSLSQQVALWYVPLSVAGPVFLDRARLGGSLSGWIAIAVAAQVALMVTFEVSRRLIHRHDPGGSRPAATLVAIMIAVLIRGAILALLAKQTGLTVNVEWTYRLAGGVTSAAAMIIVICLVIRARDLHRELVVVLDSRLASLADLDISMQSRLAEINLGITELVAAKVDPLVDNLDRVLDEVVKGADVAASLQYLRHAVDDVLRPLSHQLTTDRLDLDVLAVPTTLVHVRTDTLPRSISLRGAIFPKLCAAIVILTAVAPTARQLSALGFITFLLGLGLWVVAALGCLRWLVGRLRAPTPLAISVITLATALVVFTGVVIMGSLDLPVPDHVMIPAAILGALLGSLTSSYRAVHERRKVTESDLLEAVQALELSVSRLRQEAWIGRRRASYILHGSMQSALYAAILRLSSNPHPDPTLISEIRSDISKATAKLGQMAEPPAALRDDLAETADLWSDACDVRWTLSADAERLVWTNSTGAECVAEIVREGVGNAVRHGGAGSVTVAVDAGVDRLLIVIDDNGRSAEGQENPGLGSRMLDEMCVSWTRESTDHGTRLAAELAV